jgi:MFS family permease
MTSFEKGIEEVRSGQGRGELTMFREPRELGLCRSPDQGAEMSDSGLSTSQRVTSLAFSNAGHFVTHVLMLLYPTVVLSLGTEFGISYGSLLSLSLPGFILFGAGALPAGWLGDRWSTRGMMALFFLGCGASAVLTGLATSVAGLAVGLGLIGLFASIYHPVGVAWLVGIAKSRGRALGINGVFGNLGVASAAGLAAALTTWLGWRAAFIVPGVVAIAVGLLFLLLVRSTAYRKAEKPSAASPKSATPEMWRVFAVLGISTVCSGLVFQATTIALPKLFADRIGDVAGSVLGVGGLVTAVYVFGSLAQVVFGFLMDRVPLKPLFVSLNLLQVPLLALAAIYSGLPLLATIWLAVFFGMGTIPIPDLMLARHTPLRWRGTVYGARFVLALGVSSVAVPLVGLIRDQTGGFTLLLTLLAGLAALGTSAIAWLPGDRAALPPAPPAEAPAAEPVLVAPRTGEAGATA